MEYPNQLLFNRYCPFALNSIQSADHQNKKGNLLLFVRKDLIQAGTKKWTLALPRNTFTSICTHNTQ